MPFTNIKSQTLLEGLRISARRASFKWGHYLVLARFVSGQYNWLFYKNVNNRDYIENTALRNNGMYINHHFYYQIKKQMKTKSLKHFLPSINRRKKMERKTDRQTDRLTDLWKCFQKLFANILKRSIKKHKLNLLSKDK